ncbi:hypothetical protein Hypma_004572 [Hypsizygus marmoreus]|uniref:HPP transmembrane region domain-containing protein n=1 Tax=Hypsizygus marmoreus TaxID=39966 RepID=A0A369JXR9_HYPMA|nr:hypothetical protein Hypma_004572 [Hypsizygus marmoreus]
MSAYSFDHWQQYYLAEWPAWASRWLGYRATPPPKRPEYIIWLWSFIGAFCGISLIQAVFEQAQYFIDRGVPPIIASYGATAVLIYGAIDAPLAQPRALFGGHFIGGLTGVCITKLFHLLPTEQRFQDLVWLAGSLSCALSVVFMQMTATTHPPAGATALLAAVNPEIRDLGWYYLPVILLTSTLALVVAILVNNIQRRYPVFWFQPAVSIPAPVAPDLGGPETDSIQDDSERNATKVNSADHIKMKGEVRYLMSARLIVHNVLKTSASTNVMTSAAKPLVRLLCRPPSHPTYHCPFAYECHPVYATFAPLMSDPTNIPNYPGLARSAVVNPIREDY